jgi:hypothetical protein
MSALRRFLCPWLIAALVAGYVQMAVAKTISRAVEPVHQIALSEEKITQFLAARPALDAVLAKVPTAPDPRLMRVLNDTARENGFADYAGYEAVAVNIVWILTGIDPLNKKYIGVQAVTRLEVADLLADKALSPKDRKLRLEALHAQMLSAAPLKFAANVTLVTKFYDKLLAADISGN